MTTGAEARCEARVSELDTKLPQHDPCHTCNASSYSPNGLISQPQVPHPTYHRVPWPSSRHSQNLSAPLPLNTPSICIISCMALQGSPAPRSPPYRPPCRPTSWPLSPHAPCLCAPFNHTLHGVLHGPRRSPAPRRPLKAPTLPSTSAPSRLRQTKSRRH